MFPGPSEGSGEGNAADRSLVVPAFTHSDGAQPATTATSHEKGCPLVTPGLSRFLCRIGLIAAVAMIVGLEAQAAMHGVLRVTSFPPGAEVWVDGTFTGQTTPALLLLGTGEHLVMAKAPDGGWAPAQKSVVIERGVNALSLTLVPEGVQGPPGPQGPPGAGIPEDVTVQVDCDAGQEIKPALSTPARYLTLIVLGTCWDTQGLTIGRHNVALVGGAPGAGFRSNSTEGILLGAYGLQNIFLRDLTFRGGREALQAASGTSIVARGLDISGAVYGIHSIASLVRFHDGWLHDNSSSGINVDIGSTLTITGSEIYANHSGLAVNGGHAQIDRTTIRDNTFAGVWATSGAVVRIADSTLTRNSQALSLQVGSSGSVHRSRLADGTQGGVFVGSGSALQLWAGAIVEDNGGRAGIVVEGTSSVTLQGQSAVQGNHGDGIILSDTAELVLSVDSPVIEGNAGWGVYCLAIPDVPGIHGWTLDPANIGPNGAGRISCPGLTAP